ncbi:MAG: alpha/beta fold hydrolase, partial [Phycisphaeraceae bacterium]|nr:alpha/beta fold hydrolase [Phycisphaeraceae bacterium]
ADRLARRGVATLRYDDRGVAASSGDFSTATTRDFADDAAAALAFLKTQLDVDPARCGVAGHSEGGIVAALVGAGMAPGYPKAAPAFVISIAGTGVDGGEVLKEQMKRIMLAAGIGEAAMAAVLENQAKLLDSVRLEEFDETQVMAAIRGLQEAQFELNGFSPEEEAIRQLERQAFQQMTSPWMLEFIRFDPSRAFERIKVPILAINGTLDVQVWHEQNLPAIEAAVKAGGGEVEIAEFEGLNHLLQPSTTGAVEEYAIIDITMDEAPMEKIAEFILRVPAAVKR